MSVRPALGPHGAEPQTRPWAQRFAGAMAVSVALLGAAPAASSQDAPISIIRDTEVDEILHADADPIFVAAGLDPSAVKIYVMGDPDLNAFSAAGQNLFINTGLIEKTKNPNQLIGVIAHETGHIAGGHLARADEGAKQSLATYLFTLGLGVVAAAVGAPDAAAGLLYSSGEFAALTQAGFTRTQESSADQAAITYLEKAGESGRGIVDFFDNYRYEEVFSEAKRYKFFIDHPLTSERIEALRVRASHQPHYDVTDSIEAQARHQIMIAKLKAFTNLPQQTFFDYPESDVSFAARYARAIAYSRDLQTDKAVRLTDALIAEQPANPYLYQLKGQILFDAGRAKEAEPAHRRAVALKPAAPELLILLGQTLLAENDPAKLDEAISSLRRGVQIEPDNAYGWLFLSQAYDRRGDSGMARLAAAEENFSLGQAADAKMFAMRARHLLDKNSPEWRRATDIVLVSKPSKDDLRALAQEGSVDEPVRR
jgi:predicted Zn-dependent protease